MWSSRVSGPVSRLFVLLLPLAFLTNACDREVAAPDAERSLTETVDGGASDSGISDGAHGGEEHFFFLPPVAADIKETGTFDPRFLPYLRVEVCEWDGSACVDEPLTTFTAEDRPASTSIRVDQEDGHYLVNWNTATSGVVAGQTYHISVWVREVQFGYVNVTIVKTGNDKLSRRDIVKGRSLPVRFRIERNIDGASIIGASGGTLSSQDEKIRLTVPKDALNGETLLTILKTSTKPAPLFAGGVLGQQYHLLPRDIVFDRGVIVEWSYASLAAETGISPSNVGIVRSGDDSRSATIITKTNNTTDKVFEFIITRFSHYDAWRSTDWCPESTWCVHYNSELDEYVSWNKKVITWHIVPTNKPTLWATIPIVKDAFAKWADASNRALEFVLASDRESADIILREAFPVECPEDEWSPHPQQFVEKEPVGLACLPGSIYELDRAELNDGDQVSIVIDSERVKDSTSPRDLAFRTLLHEIGHALGLAHTQEGLRNCPVMRGLCSTGRELHEFDENAVKFLYQPNSAKDIFVANLPEANRVWINDGTGSFSETEQRLGSEHSKAVDLADLDNDGDLDAFIANGGANRVWMNDGDGQYTDSGQLLGEDESQDVVLSDVDGDGDPDAFVTNDDAGNRVWVNDGSGNFNDTGQSIGGNEELGLDWGGVALSDFNGDGTLDAFVANRGLASRVWMNDGSGIFVDSDQSLAPFAISTDVASADFDGDGDMDVYMTVSGAGNRILMNDGSGNFTDSGQRLGNAESFEVSLADVDGDGDSDAFVANLGVGNRIWLNDGKGDFTDSDQSLGGGNSSAVALADVDGDHDLDAVVGNGGFGFNGEPNTVWINDGSGSFSDSGQRLGHSVSLDIAVDDVNSK